MSDDVQSVGSESGGGGRDLNRALIPAVLALAVPAIIVCSLLFWLIPGPWWLGIPVGLAIAAGAVWLRVRRADEIVLSRLGGGLLHPDGAVRLENLVQGLSLAGGVVEPGMTVLSDQARNAMAVRRNGRNHLVVTQGLLESLEVVELEGLVAELLTRLKNGDAEAATVGAALYGGPILDGPLASVLGPVARTLLGGLLDADRDLEADRQAVSLTRYPPGLLGALAAMRRGDVSPAADSAGLSHLWIADPDVADAPQGAAARASLGLRIDILAEL
ncbi:MAG: hypothetical protein AAF531_07330 [Actinomycetota bacterium]